MRIGIVSDSHGHTARLQQALELFAAKDVQAIVHCGDISSTDSVRLLSQCPVECHLVAGNMDRHFFNLSKAAQRYPVRFSPETIEVPIGHSQYLVATHGHHEHLLAELIAGEQFPYVCHGHTHRCRDEHVGSVRVINPGSLHHPRGPKHPTVAVLDTDTDALEFLDLPPI